MPNDSTYLENRTVVITGGATGIGYAVAKECVQAGANVVLLSRNKGRLEAAQSSLSGQGRGFVRVAVVDVANPDEVQQTFDDLRQFGGELSGLVHCAAVQGPIGPTLDIEPQSWVEGVRVNLHGAFLVARQAGQIMRRQGFGSIVLLSGGGATGPFPRYTSYAASKAGVVRMAESLAYELVEYGVSVNCVAPGFVATGIHEATLAAGDAAGHDYLDRTRELLISGSVPVEIPARLIMKLLSQNQCRVTGKLISAAHDDWSNLEDWDTNLRSDAFTLRRIKPGSDLRDA